MDRLKGVEYFKRIYELGSFTAAADEFQCSVTRLSGRGRCARHDQ